MLTFNYIKKNNNLLQWKMNIQKKTIYKIKVLIAKKTILNHAKT